MNGLREAAALAFVSVLSGAVLLSALPWRSEPHPEAPAAEPFGGYLGSGACRSCHPSEHASFSKTYHHTMTRPAAALSWDGIRSPSIPARLEIHDRVLSLSRDSAGAILYRGPDLHAIGRSMPALARQRDTSPELKRNKSHELFRAAPEVQRHLVLVTGSHHYLAFWIDGGEDAELRQLPFVYLLDEQRFLPREEAFLQPPDALPHIARWNANCIQCHTVGGRPRQTEGRDQATGAFWEKYDTKVVEEGISCEACHGPGARHAAHYRNPIRRVRARNAGAGAEFIFVPRPEEGAASAETCGQCHSYFVPKDPDEWWESGFSTSYEAGDPLSSSRTILRAPGGSDENTDGSHLIDHELSTIFWNDGSIIVGGREYNGLSESPCFKQGTGDRKLACTSCHSMHEGDPDRQMHPEKTGDRMCTSCHEDIDPTHSRHEPSSPGARCVSCHMPRTSYALLHGIPNHQIASPTMAMTEPPHACSLCHLDRSARWIHAELLKFGALGSEPSESDLPLAVERALSGNAAERALYAYALGTDEARTTASPKVARLVLPHLKEDPYAAVRLIAERAERKLKEPLIGGAEAAAANPRLPSLSPAVLSRLSQNRDNTPITVSE